jgi:hypothetical protein
MESQTNIPPHKSWRYRVCVLLFIPCLYIYYRLLQPIGDYFKDLKADQDGNLRHRERRRPNIREPFIRDAAEVLAQTFTKYIKRYWRLLAIVFFIWLAYVIGIVSTLVCIVSWLAVWLIYNAGKIFFRGINQ